MFGVDISLPNAPTSVHPMSSTIISKMLGLVAAVAFVVVSSKRLRTMNDLRELSLSFICVSPVKLSECEAAAYTPDQHLIFV
jgi:hypothetical protein